MRRSKAPPWGVISWRIPYQAPPLFPTGGGVGRNIDIYIAAFISHRSSVFEGRHNAIDLRRSAHTCISSIFESRHIDLRRSTHRSSKIEGGNIAPTTQHRADIPTIRHRILSTTAHRNYYIQDSARYIRTVYITFIGERSEPPLSVELSEFSLYLYNWRAERATHLSYS